ncbi:muts domain V-domain-containing protein [Cunninghamella echinulata]|nr:muts domain V-domain-containing protein [Cunninghamella echinulata]
MLLRTYSVYKCSYNIYHSFRYFSSTISVKKRVTSGTTEQLLGSLNKNTKVKKPSLLSTNTTKQLTDKTLAPKLKTTGSIVLDAVYEYTLKYPLCVLLIQVGDFYELYDTHATKYASLLDLKLTRKQVSTGHVVDFAGFPSRALDRYVDILVNRLGCRVAICEQTGINTRHDGSILGVQRDITRIITPGTVIEEKYLDAHNYNYLLAVYPIKTTAITESATIGLAWVDLSIGEFILQQSTVDSFKDDIVRIKPREVILPDWMQPSQYNSSSDQNNNLFDLNWNNYDPITKILASEYSIALTYQSDSTFNASEYKKSLQTIFNQDKNNNQLNHLLSTFSDQSLAAGMAILHYIDQTHVGKKPTLQFPLLFLTQDTLRIDSAAMASLELLKGLKDGSRKDSLLGILDRTVTDAGSRLLSQWISSPLGTLDLIHDRLDVVDYFYHDSFLLNDFRYQLKQSTDTQRALQRLSMGRGQYIDLIDIHSTLSVIKAIQQLFQHHQNNQTIPIAMKKLLFKLNAHDDLSKDIQLAFIDQHTTTSTDMNQVIAAATTAASNGDQNHGDDDDYSEISYPFKENYYYGNVNPNYHPTLKRLYNKMKKLEKKKTALQEDLQVICGRSITLTTNSPYRHIVEVNATQAKKLEEHYQGQEGSLVLVHRTKNKKRYHLQLWTDLSIQLEETIRHIADFETQVFQKIVEQLLERSHTIRQSCITLAQLDILSTFSWLASKNNWIRPQLESDRHDINIFKGRHPVIETYLGKKGRSFTQNDCQLTNNQRIWLLTGPNMGGKSTFLRQNAIIVIMAHMGCFVPAERATIGLTDCIFSRVGAADNITQDQSTFMVEMTETATILKHATSKSLVIMDEVGRGTSTADGFSLAFAILNHLDQQIGCNTLFATHYHELADTVHAFQHLKCFMTSIYEDDVGFTFLHRVEPGVCKQSHGLKVAQIAGLPPSVINIAKSVWQSLNHTPIISVNMTKEFDIKNKHST